MPIASISRMVWGTKVAQASRPGHGAPDQERVAYLRRGEIHDPDNTDRMARVGGDDEVVDTPFHHLHQGGGCIGVFVDRHDGYGADRTERRFA